VIILEHHSCKLDTALPFISNMTTSYQIRMPVFFRTPAESLISVSSPEIHGLREIGPVKIVVLLNFVLLERQGIGIHFKERLHHVIISGSEHRPVGKPRILPPVTRSPRAVIGAEVHAIVSLSSVDCEYGTVEFDRHVPASAACGDPVLQGISPCNDIGIIFGLGVDIDKASLPEFVPPLFMFGPERLRRYTFVFCGLTFNRFDPLFRCQSLSGQWKN